MNPNELSIPTSLGHTCTRHSYLKRDMPMPRTQNKTMQEKVDVLLPEEKEEIRQKLSSSRSCLAQRCAWEHVVPLDCHWGKGGHGLDLGPVREIEKRERE